VAVAIVVASVIAYVAVRAELRGQVDDSLRQVGDFVQQLPADAPGEITRNILVPPPDVIQPPGIGATFVQRIAPDGTASQPAELGAALPITATTDEIASTGRGIEFRDADVDGRHVRVLTLGLGGAGALQIARSLESTDDVLANLRVVLFLVIAGGTGLAALLARRFADRVVAPISGLTHAAEHITETEDLSRRIAVSGEDEVGRLAARFNSMLATLAASRAQLSDSVRAQRQLVADASHELRTPVASVRTDIEVLRENPDLPAAERAGILARADRRVTELGALIADVIELARDDEVDDDATEVRLDRLVFEAVERMRDHEPDREYRLELAETVVEGRPDRLARAVNNLLDNANKYSPAGRPIEVGVADGGVTVRDHGPGIAAEEIDRVFDRFRRGAGSRGVPGSGLGLAIVKQVAEAHGGCVTAANADGGGSLFTLRLLDA
jgi:two-component system sensor histidine kinase MprB